MSDDRGELRPSFSAVVVTRRPFAALEDVVAILRREVHAVDGELVVVSGAEDAPMHDADGVRFVAMNGEHDIMRLRARGFGEARGEVIAVGEDHAFPLEGWAAAILRAHEENPEMPVVLGSLVNTTDRTSAARANFLAFAAPFAPPTPSLPPRPPPISTVTMKRSVLETYDGSAGTFEATVLPALWERGQMINDDRIQMDHRQPFGLTRAMRNSFDVARASYGYARAGWSWRQRWGKARWALRNIPPTSVREARIERRRTPGPRRDVVAVALIGTANALGAVTGALLGPGRAADRSA